MSYSAWLARLDLSITRLLAAAAGLPAAPYFALVVRWRDWWRRLGPPGGLLLPHLDSLD